MGNYVINHLRELESEAIFVIREIVDSNLDKAWGAYFCIDENQAQDFSDKFFDGGNTSLNLFLI
jgi:hypothetical protein